ncbi:MAG: amidohydrolase family protein [Spirochaetia bacterium]|jgi:dihydroorotase|nr:amidohydrolase family protein [Spirochaetia bacterium]
MKYCVWIKNARIVDPSRGIDGTGDILTADNKIVPFDSRTAEQATDVLDAAGCLAVPGLIDFHAHLARGMSDHGVHPDVMGLPNGITAAVDAGSLGTAGVEAFIRNVVASSEMTLRCYMHVAAIGVTTGVYQENPDPALYDRDSIRYLLERFPGDIIGLKLRMGKTFSDGLGLAPLVAAKEISRQLGQPLCLHLRELTEFTYGEALGHLGAGDVLCHFYQALGGHSLLDPSGKVSPAFREARSRGVLFDSAVAMSNHDLTVMRKAFDDGFYPDLLGTDVVLKSVYRGRTFGLPYVMSKHLALGMPLAGVIRACTQTAARLMGLEGKIGTLRPGANADIAILKIREKPMSFQDNYGNVVQGSELLLPQVTIKNGRVVYKRIEFDL